MSTGVHTSAALSRRQAAPDEARHPQLVLDDEHAHRRILTQRRERPMNEVDCHPSFISRH